MARHEWEYMLLNESTLTQEQVVERLNELGREGWEFVANVGYEKLDSLVLKRPRKASGKASKR